MADKEKELSPINQLKAIAERPNTPGQVAVDFERVFTTRLFGEAGNVEPVDVNDIKNNAEQARIHQDWSTLGRLAPAMQSITQAENAARKIETAFSEVGYRPEDDMRVAVVPVGLLLEVIDLQIAQMRASVETSEDASSLLANEQSWFEFARNGGLEPVADRYKAPVREFALRAILDKDAEGEFTYGTNSDIAEAVVLENLDENERSKALHSAQEGVRRGLMTAADKITEAATLYGKRKMGTLAPLLQDEQVLGQGLGYEEVLMMLGERGEKGYGDMSPSELVSDVLKRTQRKPKETKKNELSYDYRTEFALSCRFDIEGVLEGVETEVKGISTVDKYEMDFLRLQMEEARKAKSKELGGPPKVKWEEVKPLVRQRMVEATVDARGKKVVKGLEPEQAPATNYLVETAMAIRDLPDPNNSVDRFMEIISPKVDPNVVVRSSHAEDMKLASWTRTG